MISIDNFTNPPIKKKIKIETYAVKTQVKLNFKLNIFRITYHSIILRYFTCL